MRQLTALILCLITFATHLRAASAEEYQCQNCTQQDRILLFSIIEFNPPQGNVTYNARKWLISSIVVAGAIMEALLDIWLLRAAAARGRPHPRGTTPIMGRTLGLAFGFAPLLNSGELNLSAVSQLDLGQQQDIHLAYKILKETLKESSIPVDAVAEMIGRNGVTLKHVEWHLKDNGVQITPMITNALIIYKTMNVVSKLSISSYHELRNSLLKTYTNAF